MNKSYIEWIDYYENATKEDVIQDMMLDINSIKEKDKEIERLNNIINETIKDIEHSTLLLEDGQVELKDTPFGKRILYKLKGSDNNE